MSSTIRIALSALLILFAMNGAMSGKAFANRVAKTNGKATVAGSKVKSWKSKGTQFRHETLRSDGGSVIHWQRSATTKKGQTNFHGVTWGTKVKGIEIQGPNGTHRTTRYTHADGSTSTAFSVTNNKGTTKTQQSTQNGIRHITSWKLGKTQMTDNRLYDFQGNLVSRVRSGRGTK